MPRAGDELLIRAGLTHESWFFSSPDRATGVARAPRDEVAIRMLSAIVLTTALLVASDRNHDELGARIAPLNDVDGDGCADFALDDGLGNAWVVSGKSGRAIAHVEGRELGWNHCLIAPLLGDADGDGAWDVIEIEHHTTRELLMRSGKDLHCVRELPVPADQDGFIGVPAPAGDWDSDGVPDIAVTVVHDRLATIAILSGKDGSVLQSIGAGSEWSKRLYLHREKLVLLSSCRAGEVRPASFLFRSGGARDLVLIPRDATNASIELAHNDQYLWINSGTGFVGDVGGDGDADLVVRRWFDVSKDRVRFVHGRDGQRQYELRFVLVSGRTGADLEVMSEEGGAMQEGLVATRVADLDGDGIGEILVGDAGWPTGSVYVFSGKDRRLLWTLREDQECCAGSCRFGANVTALGDVDGDGTSDFAITSSSGVDANDPGCVAVYSGKSRRRLLSIWKSDLVAVQAAVPRSSK
jgi:hypothetical protein